MATKVKTYSEKLRDPRWQKRRLEIMERDGFKCVQCEDEASMLSVHHSYYVSKREPWEYPNWSLKTLCSDCHEEAHNHEESRLESGSAGSLVFEDVVGFLGCRAINGCDEVWDIAVEIAMLSSEIGNKEALKFAEKAIRNRRINGE